MRWAFCSLVSSRATVVAAGVSVAEIIEVEGRFFDIPALHSAGGRWNRSSADNYPQRHTAFVHGLSAGFPA
jgi:hypothetical protein